MTARLLLIRHGQIAANLTQHWHGTTDSPLTDEGIRQARAVAAHVARSHPVRAIYSSPLQRTRNTAQAIADATRLPVLPDPRLIEYGIGELEGIHYRDLAEGHRFFDRVKADPGYAPPGGESIRSVARRMTAVLGDIATRHAGEHVVVVSHGAAIGIALGEILHADPLRWTEYGIRNCSITEFELDPAPRVLSLNRADHLD